MLMLCFFLLTLDLRSDGVPILSRALCVTPPPSNHRQFAKKQAPDVRPAHFNAIISRAFDAVPPPDDNYWAQLEHVPAAAAVPKVE